MLWYYEDMRHEDVLRCILQCTHLQWTQWLWTRSSRTTIGGEAQSTSGNQMALIQNWLAANEHVFMAAACAGDFGIEHFKGFHPSSHFSQCGGYKVRGGIVMMASSYSSCILKPIKWHQNFVNVTNRNPSKRHSPHLVSSLHKNFWHARKRRRPGPDPRASKFKSIQNGFSPLFQ